MFFLAMHVMSVYIRSVVLWCQFVILADFSLDYFRDGIVGTLRVGGAMDDAILSDICMVWPSKTNVLFE